MFHLKTWRKKTTKEVKVEFLEEFVTICHYNQQSYIKDCEKRQCQNWKGRREEKGTQ